MHENGKGGSDMSFLFFYLVKGCATDVPKVVR